MLPDQLRKAFESVTGTMFVSIDTAHPVRLNGGNANPMQGAITKVVKNMQVMVFSNPAFERLVNRRLRAEGYQTEFKAGPRAWGVREENSPFVMHEGKLYLEVIVLRPGKVSYLNKGMPVDAALIEGLPVDRVHDSGVVIRCFLSDSIKRVVINGRIIN